MKHHGWVTAALALIFVVVSFQGFAATQNCASSGCINLLFDGDSISAGSGASLGLDKRVAEAVGDEVELHNVAVPGRPVSDCLRLFRERVKPLLVPESRSNVIVFHAGDNDIAQGRDAGQTYAAFADYVAAAHEQGWKIVVSTELRRPDFAPLQEAELEDYNNRLRTNAAGADVVVDFDTDRRMLALPYRSDPALFTRDGIHPSDGGYAILAAMLAPAVKRVTMQAARLR